MSVSILVLVWIFELIFSVNKWGQIGKYWSRRSVSFLVFFCTSLGCLLNFLCICVSFERYLFIYFYFIICIYFSVIRWNFVNYDFLYLLNITNHITWHSTLQPSLYDHTVHKEFYIHVLRTEEMRLLPISFIGRVFLAAFGHLPNVSNKHNTGLRCLHMSLRQAGLYIVQAKTRQKPRNSPKPLLFAFLGDFSASFCVSKTPSTRPNPKRLHSRILPKRAERVRIWMGVQSDVMWSMCELYFCSFFSVFLYTFWRDKGVGIFVENSRKVTEKKMVSISTQKKKKQHLKKVQSFAAD